MWCLSSWIWVTSVSRKCPSSIINWTVHNFGFFYSRVVLQRAHTPGLPAFLVLVLSHSYWDEISKYLFTFYLFIYLCVWVFVCVCVCTACMCGGREQLVRISFLLLPCCSQQLNSGHRAWQQAPPSAELSHQTLKVF